MQQILLSTYVRNNFVLEAHSRTALGVLALPSQGLEGDRGKQARAAERWAPWKHEAGTTGGLHAQLEGPGWKRGVTLEERFQLTLKGPVGANVVWGGEKVSDR